MTVGRNPESRGDECLTRDDILEYLDGVLAFGGGGERRLEAHLRDCPTCGEFLEEVRREVETRNLSISLAWRQERISCPHRDLLEAYHHGSLTSEEAGFVRFHVERVGCPYCAANLEDVASVEKAEQPAALRDLKDEVLRSTTTFLRRRPGS